MVRKHQTRNLEIPGSPFARPGMTVDQLIGVRFGSTISNIRGNSSISAISSPSSHRIARHLDLAGGNRFRKRRQLGDDLVKHAARQREAGIGIGRLRARDIGQRRILQVENERLAGIGKIPVQHDALALGLRPVEANAEHVPQLLGAQRCQRLARHRRARRGLRHAVSQLLRAEQISVAPGRTFRGIAELLEGVGEQRACRLVVGIGEHQMAHCLRDKTEFAFGKILARAIEDRLRTAHVLDILLAAFDRRQRIEVDGIGVVPAEIFLVDRLHVVADVAVIAAAVPGAVEALGQLDRFGDLGRASCRDSSGGWSGHARTCRGRAAGGSWCRSAPCPTPASDAGRTSPQPCRPTSAALRRDISTTPAHRARRRRGTAADCGSYACSFPQGSEACSAAHRSASPPAPRCSAPSGIRTRGHRWCACRPLR